MGEIFLYPIIFATVGWAARLAKAKGRNPWIWGGAAILLSLLHVPQSAVLSVIPVGILIFTKNPSSRTANEEKHLACARCSKAHSDGQHFCTSCGLDLSKPYTLEVADENPSFSTQPSVRTTMPSTSITSPVETGEPVQQENASTAEYEPLVEAEENESEALAPEAVTEHVPWGTYDPGPAPTAAVMVSRGMERFQEEKYQEAIDQFTKAIGLDHNYAEAWEKRADAYAQMGRSQQAEDDRRHLQGLDPSSLTG